MVILIFGKGPRWGGSELVFGLTKRLVFLTQKEISCNRTTYIGSRGWLDERVEGDGNGQRRALGGMRMAGRTGGGRWQWPKEGTGWDEDGWTNGWRAMAGGAGGLAGGGWPGHQSMSGWERDTGASGCGTHVAGQGTQGKLWLDEWLGQRMAEGNGWLRATDG